MCTAADCTASTTGTTYPTTMPIPTVIPNEGQTTRGPETGTTGYLTN